jgi:hypothetical protein
MPIALHEDVFYEYFKPVRQCNSQNDIWGGHGLETFGKDLEIVRRHNPAFVWTVIDGETGSDQWIITGIHHINRICYLISEVPHDWLDVEFRLRFFRSLTESGLKRQTSRLKNYVTAHRANA